MNFTIRFAMKWLVCFWIGTMLAEAVFANADSSFVTLVVQRNASPRVQFGADKLMSVLTAKGYRIQKIDKADKTKGRTIFIGTIASDLIQDLQKKQKLFPDSIPKKEGFIIRSLTNKDIVVAGVDESGTLYGCLSLKDSVQYSGHLPDKVNITDQPQMVLRGACIGLQKPYYLPGRTVYEYPYTPETFPWFYDKQLWIRYLDMLVENRMNSLYLWNGHPFASLVRLKDYPFAVEVDDSTFKKNEEIFKFLTTEADKRGIWVIQMFYNIIVSKPFAEHYHIKTQDRNRPIIPIIADYTRKSIAAFVSKYPNVGLMVCLGEAMEGVGQDDIDWFTKTIIPGVKDGLKILGKKEEPPIVLRAHDTDAPSDMKAALPLYHNLYTEAKFNGEALTTYAPRGPWAELHRTLSSIGTVQIENVHILANLEPFRYASPDFIQKSVQAMHQVYESNGLHLYPQASYWDWPYTADKTSPRLLQIDRDAMWYAAWARYAWNSNYSVSNEKQFWSRQLAAKYGCSNAAAANIVEAYEQSGEISPKLLRRYGITDGNRQTLTLGMFMTQLINPKRYGLFPLLYNSEAPEGEMIIDYAAKEAKHEKHIGETPIQIAAEVIAHGDKAVAAIEKATSAVTENRDEFSRLKNDMYCYRALANFYATKAKAAVAVLEYKYTGNKERLSRSLSYLTQSVQWFAQLDSLTKNAYFYANSMQTQQRKIPISGLNGTNKTWSDLLPLYQKELDHFRRVVDSIQTHTISFQMPVFPALQNASVQLLSPLQWVTLDSAHSLYADTVASIKYIASAIRGLRAVVLSSKEQLGKGTMLSFKTETPVKVLVGYFNSKDKEFLTKPNLETDASANEYGQAEAAIANAVVLHAWPSLNVHSYSFKPGDNTLTLRKGLCVVLGFINENEKLPHYDAGLTENGYDQQIDWMFE